MQPTDQASLEHFMSLMETLEKLPRFNSTNNAIARLLEGRFWLLTALQENEIFIKQKAQQLIAEKETADRERLKEAKVVTETMIST